MVPGADLKVLVLDDDRCQPVLHLLDQPKQLADIEGAGSKGLAGTGIAQALGFEEDGCPPDIIVHLDPLAQKLQFLCRRFRQHDFCQLQFFFHVGIVELLMLKELDHDLEVIPGVQVAEAKLPDDRHRSFLHAPEQINQVPVKVVVDLLLGDRGLAQQDAAGATEEVYEGIEFQWESGAEDGQQRRLVSHTRYGGANRDHLFSAGGIHRPENKKTVPIVMQGDRYRLKFTSS